jgi:hypothetical protein
LGQSIKVDAQIKAGIACAVAAPSNISKERDKRHRVLDHEFKRHQVVINPIQIK